MDGNEEIKINLLSNCPPTSFISDPKISKYHVAALRKYWPNYTAFLKEIGEINTDDFIAKTFKNESLEQKQEKYKKAIEILQKTLGRKFLVSSDFQKAFGSGFGRIEFIRLGGFRNFRKVYGIPDYHTFTCVECGKQASRKLRYHNHNNYCNKRCQHNAFYKRHIKAKRDAINKPKLAMMTNCKYCNKEIHKYNNRYQKVEFCRKLCNQRYRLYKDRTIIEKNCENCNKKIKGLIFKESKKIYRFCCQKCANEYRKKK